MIKLCRSCLDRRKLQAPEPRFVAQNVRKFFGPYCVALAVALCVSALLGVGAWALLPALSYGLAWVYFSYVRPSPLASPGSSYRATGLLLVHVFLLGFLGGTVVIFAVCVTGAVCVLHASARKPSKRDQMDRIAQSTSGGMIELMEMGGHRGENDNVDEVETFRKHAESVKMKYGI